MRSRIILTVGTVAVLGALLGCGSEPPAKQPSSKLANVVEAVCQDHYLYDTLGITISSATVVRLKPTIWDNLNDMRALLEMVADSVKHHPSPGHLIAFACDGARFASITFDGNTPKLVMDYEAAKIKREKAAKTERIEKEKAAESEPTFDPSAVIGRLQKPQFCSEAVNVQWQRHDLGNGQERWLGTTIDNALMFEITEGWLYVMGYTATPTSTANTLFAFAELNSIALPDDYEEVNQGKLLKLIEKAATEVGSEQSTEFKGWLLEMQKNTVLNSVSYKISKVQDK